jgi:hypothetical protein
VPAGTVGAARNAGAAQIPTMSQPESSVAAAAASAANAAAQAAAAAVMNQPSGAVQASAETMEQVRCSGCLAVTDQR